MDWPIPLDEKPSADLMAFGVHGPRLVERFILARHWAVHLYTYSAKLLVDGVEFRVRPGTVTVNPPGVETVYHFETRSMHACAHFYFPPEAEPSFAVPAFQDLGARFGGIYQAFEEGIASYSLNRRRAEARLWDILWQLVDQPAGSPSTKVYHPAVARAVEIIDLRLSEPLSIVELAVETGLSHNQLTRLFRVAFGTTVVGYIRDRRVERALHLLVNTGLSIKTIAAQVGVEDTRYFNKIIHQCLGNSPQGIRMKGQDR